MKRWVVMKRVWDDKKDPTMIDEGLKEMDGHTS
jgi:hypothetical protein